MPQPSPHRTGFASIAQDVVAGIAGGSSDRLPTGHSAPETLPSTTTEQTTEVRVASVHFTEGGDELGEGWLGENLGGQETVLRVMAPCHTRVTPPPEMTGSPLWKPRLSPP